tara:strand:+ start:1410 stop:2105 length:696 start_codon:yes stop_codon:yes gene_type:complete
MVKRSSDAIIKTLEQKFNLNDYLELRDCFPMEDMPLQLLIGEENTYNLMGFEIALKHEREFEKFGFIIEDYINILGGDEESIDKVCLSCLRAISNREQIIEKKAHAVASGDAIGDAFIDLIIIVILESISSFELAVPNSFQILMKVRLGLFKNKLLANEKLEDRRTHAANLIAKNPNIKDTEIAKLVGVNKSSISKWRKEPKFIRKLTLFQGYRIDGSPIIPSNIKKLLKE